MTDRVVSVRLQAITAPYSAAMGQATAATARFGATATTAGTATAASGARIAGSATAAGGAMARMSAVGMGMRAAVADPFKAITSPAGLAAIAIAVTARAAINFETAWTGVLKTVEGTPAELAAIKDGIRAMAREIPASTAEIAKVAEAAGQLGIETPNILGFTRVMIDLGNTTNLSAEQAASALARFANITNMSQKEFSNLGSAVVHLGNNMETTEAEIVEFGLRIAGAGELAGFTEPQILGIGASMSSIGIQAEAGGTAVQKVLLEMTDAANTGGKKLKIFAETSGLSADEFARQWRANPAEAFALFVEGLGAAGQHGRAILDELGLADQRLIRAFLSLGQASGVVREGLDLATGGFVENKALTEEAEKRYGTTASQLEILGNNVNDLAISLGDGLLPAINAMLGPLAEFLGVLSDIIRLDWGSVGEALDKNNDSIMKWADGSAVLALQEELVTEELDRLIASATLADIAMLNSATAATTAADELNNLGRKAGGAQQKMVTFAGMSGDALKEWRGDVRGSFDAVAAAFDAIGDKSVDTAEEVFDAFHKQIRAIIDFRKNMETLANKGLPEPAAAIIATLGEVGAKVAQILAEEPRENVEKFGRQLLRATGLSKGMAGDIIDIFNGIKDKTPGIGFDAAAGLADGIRDGKANVITAAAEVSEAALAAAMHRLGIESPSKEFIKIGELSIDGFVIGLASGISKVEKESKRVANVAANAFRGIMKGSFGEGKRKFGDILGADFGDEGPTAGGIVSFLQDQLSQVQRFAAAMGKITARAGGVGLRQDLAQALAEAGPGGLNIAEAIAAGGEGTIRQINALLGQIARTTPKTAIAAINAETATVNAPVVNLVGGGIGRMPFPFPIRGGDGGSAVTNSSSITNNIDARNQSLDEQQLVRWLQRMEALGA